MFVVGVVVSALDVVVVTKRVLLLILIVLYPLRYRVYVCPSACLQVCYATHITCSCLFTGFVRRTTRGLVAAN